MSQHTPTPPVTNVISDDVLSAWKQQNQRLVADVSLKQTAVVSAPHNNQDASVTDPRKKQVSAITTHIDRVQQLARQAAERGYYCLQDVCLSVVESLNRLLANNHAISDEVLLHLKQLPTFISEYATAPLTATQGIMTVLRHPALDVPLSDAEFVLFEKLLLAENSSQMLYEPIVFNQNSEALLDAEIIDTVALEQIPASALEPLPPQLIVELETLADQAAAKGCYGFQDACLLIAETLREQTHISSALLNGVNDCSAVFNAYQQNSTDSIEQILNLLHHPDLALSLSDDEFALLETEIRQNCPAVAKVVTENTVAAGDDANAIATQGNSTTSFAPTARPVSHGTQELVDLLLLETATVNQRLQNLRLDQPAHIAEELIQLKEELQRFANASHLADFEGLAQVCIHVLSNVSHYARESDHFDAEKLALLREWVQTITFYLSHHDDDSASYPLLAQLSKAAWAIPLSAETSASLLAQLQHSRHAMTTAVAPARKHTANADDVSLLLPEDVNRELLDLLLQELPRQTQQFSQAMQQLQAGGHLQDVTLAQRIAHTIKGSGNTVGIKGIAVLTHHLEDILTACANAQRLPSKALLNTLILAADCLEGMSEALLGLAETPNEAQQVLQAILDWSHYIEREGLPSSETQLPARSIIPDDKRDDAPKTTVITALDSQEAMVRVPSSQIENLFRLSGESIILNAQTHERQRRLRHQLQAMEEQFALLRQLGAELEQLIDLKDLSGRSLNKTAKDFDTLELDQYNELHTASRRMVEASVDAREISADMKKELDFMSEVLEYQQRLVIDTQESIMQTRLVTVASIIPRLQRAVRQTCRLTEKQCELTVSGETLLIDGNTLNAMVDPLMHLLRNAIDHGIEAEAQRYILGKPRSGQIQINFDREGNTILVTVYDDGQGLDFVAIRAAAEQRGLLSAGQIISEEELKGFILHPNFSTRRYSTQTSGRGVGMDAVYNQVLALGGGLSLNSVKGQGTTIELRVPLPLSRSHALLANTGNYKVAISSKGLTEIIYFGSDELKTLNQAQVLILRDEVYPMLNLEELLHIPEHRQQERSREHGAVLLVSNENKITAVLVERITDSRDVVIKGLGCYMRKIPGFIGATILGDGTVTPVLDIPELLRTLSQARNQDSITTHRHNADMDSGQPSVLIVEDSLSQRRALEQILTDAGYRVRIARDGVEATELLTHFKPTIILTDLEMPRMNGIELTSHIRSQSATKTVPIIMITSRTTQKHQHMAQDAGINCYFTKPVPEEDLLNKVHQLINTNKQGVSY